MKVNKSKKIAIFEGSHIRRHWDDKKELWYFNKTVTKCHGLKMQGSEVSEEIGQLKIERMDDDAKIACENSGEVIHNHFVDATEMVSIGSGAEKIYAKPQKQKIKQAERV